MTGSGGGEVDVGEVLVVEGECGGEDLLAVGGDAVEALVGDFGDELVAAEFGDEP